MGKRQKEHRKKVEARNGRINEEKKIYEKRQREFIMDLIKKEKEKGAFENNTLINPNIDPIIEGPSF